jgi:hypothetical protein
MKHGKQFKKRDSAANRRARRAVNPNLTDEERDRLISEALDRGMKAVEQLDPIVRETFRDDPAALAEWDEIMHMCDDLDEEDDK